jgi:hypothetical protein
MQRARKMMTNRNLIAVNGSNLCVQLLSGTSVEIGEELNGAQVEIENVSIPISLAAPRLALAPLPILGVVAIPLAWRFDQQDD